MRRAIGHLAKQIHQNPTSFQRSRLNFLPVWTLDSVTHSLSLFSSVEQITNTTSVALGYPKITFVKNTIIFRFIVTHSENSSKFTKINSVFIKCMLVSNMHQNLRNRKKYGTFANNRRTETDSSGTNNPLNAQESNADSESEVC